MNIRSGSQQDRKQFLQKVEKGLANFNISATDRVELDDMLGVGKDSLKTPHATNRQSLELLDHVLPRVLRERRRGRRYYFMTIIDEAWNTLDRHTSIDLKSIKSRTTHALGDCGLDGICFVEFQPFTNYPRKGLGRLISPHVHAIVWAGEDVKVVRRQVIEKLSGRFSGNFGAPGVDIKRVKDSDVDVARAIFYSVKAPSSAKKLNHRRNGQIYLDGVIGDYRPDLCLRVTEVLSHFTSRNLCFGRGEGATVLREAFSNLKKLEHKSPKNCGVHSDPSSLWKRIRKASPGQKYSPVVVHR